MKMRWLAAFLVAGPALAQTGEQAVGSTATATGNAVLDEAVFGVTISAPVTTTIEQAVRMLQDFGVKEENLVSAATATLSPVAALPGMGATPSLSFQFRFTQPAARFSETLNRLDAFSRRLPEGATAFDYRGTLGASRSAADRALAPLIPGLFERVRNNAATLARAAGVDAGLVASLTAIQRPAQSPGLTISARFGRAPERSVSTTCSSTVSLAPDIASLRVAIRVPGATPRAEVMQIAGRFGLNEADLSDVTWSLGGFGVRFVPPNLPPLVTPDLLYQFDPVIPIARLRETIDRIMELQRTRPAPLSNVTFAFGLNASGGVADQAVTNGARSLLADCRASADVIARAAGVRITGVRSLTSQTPVAPAAFAGFIIPVLRTPVTGDFVFAGSTLQIPVSLNVIFGME